MYYTQSQWLLLFFTYCFLGWVWESCYVSFLRKEWVNRGFLHGPIVPIYGFGAVSILLLTLPFKENILLIYILGLLAASTLEYVTGALMEKIFQMRYWDYSHHKFNLKGRISLFVSLAWGLFSILLVKLLHPPIEKILLKIPNYLAEPISLILIIIFAVDATMSIQSALDMKKLLKQLKKSNELLSTLELKINNLASKISHTSNEFQKQIHKIEKDIEKIKIKYKELKLPILLSEKADIIIKEIQLKLKSTSSELEKKQLSKNLKNSNELKKRLKNIELRRTSLKDKEYKKLRNLIRKYPTLVSNRFKEVLNEIKSLNETRKRK